jgi:PAS domain S-box-containing protein
MKTVSLSLVQSGFVINLLKKIFFDCLQSFELSLVCLVLTCFKPGAEEFIRVGVLVMENDSKVSVNFDQSSIGFALIDSSTGTFTKVNKKFCDIVGFEMDSALGRSFMEIAHPGDTKVNMQKMQQLMEGGLDECNMEMQYTQEDGSPVTCTLTIFALWDINEELNYHLAIIEDVSVRKSAKEKAQKINDLLGQRVVDLTAALEEKTKELEVTERLLKDDILKIKEAN